MQLVVNKRETGSRDAQRTRDSLLEAAAKLFAVHGFDGATAEVIARHAGVNKAMINYHFGGKKGLYAAILTGVLAEVREALHEISRSRLPADVQLAQCIARLGAFHRERPTFSAMVLREVLSGGRFLDDVLMPQFLGVFESIGGIIRSGVRDGRFRPVDPLLTHLSLVGAMTFFFATATFRERLTVEGRLPALAPSAGQFIAHLQQLFARGLEPRPGARGSSAGDAR